MLALDPQALAVAADRLDAVAASLSRLDLATPFRSADVGLPGTASAAACAWAADDVSAVLTEWAGRLHDLADTARWVARDAERTDQEVARALAGGPP